MRPISVIGKCAQRSTPHQCIAGFTLIELMVVLTILVLSVAVIPLSLNRMMPGRRVAVAADRIGSVIRDAQLSSVGDGAPWQVSVQDHSLTVAAVQSEPVSDTARSVAPRTVVVPSTVRLKLASIDGRTVPALTVYPDGATSGGRIDIADGAHHNAVNVSALTGRVVRVRE